MANQNVKITIKALDKTKAGFNSAGAGLRKLGSSVASFAKVAGVAGVAAAGIFGVMIKQSLNATDSLGKTARKIGVTTEALSSMRYAADLTGVSTETMDMALQRFTRRAAEAARGTGEAKGALKELRLDAAQLIKMPLEQQMQELAGAFETVETDAERVMLAMKLFDSEGVALVNTLGIGKEALIEMAAEANALGIALSGEAVKGVEDANDSFTKLKTLFKGVRDQVTAALAPALETLATTLQTKLLNAINEADGGVEAFAQNMAVNILEAVQFVLTTMQRLVNGTITSINKITEAANSFTGLFRDYDEKNVQQLNKDLEEINKELKILQSNDSRRGMFGRSQEIKELQEEKQEVQNLIKAKEKLGQVGEIPQATFADKINADLDTLIASIFKVKEAKTETGLEKPPTPTPEDTKSALQKNFDALKQQGKNEVKFAEMTADEKVSHVAGGLQKQFALAGQNSKKMFALSKAAGIAEALVSTYQGAAKSMGAYPFPINVAMAAASVAAGMAQVSAIRSQTPSFDGGGFTGSGSRSGGIDGKGGFLSILHPQESIIDHTKPNMSNIVKKLPSFEGGGYTGGAMPALNNSVTNNIDNSTNTTSSTNRNDKTEQQVIVNQTINVTTGVQGTVRAEIANLMPQIAEAAQNAVLSTTMRGGSYSKQLLGR